MKAIIATRYGTPDVLRLEEVEKPTPKDDEVLIRIQAASMNAANVHFLTGKSLLVRLMAGGLSRPKQPIPGSDFAGRVEAVGRNVTRFQPGDDVFGDLADSGGGTFAEYVAAPEHVLVRKPAAMSFEDAAAIPLAGVTALQGLRDYARVQPGQRVLVNGASGGVGSFAVQIAKAYGAEVTAVASTRKLDMLRSVGADRVIDNTREDFTRNGERYDLIFDVAAYRPFGDMRRALAPGGMYVLAGGSIARILQFMLVGPVLSRTGPNRMVNFMARSKADDLEYLASLYEAGDVRPVVDRCYPLSETAEAFRHVIGRQVQGKVVISIGAAPTV